MNMITDKTDKMVRGLHMQQARENKLFTSFFVFPVMRYAIAAKRNSNAAFTGTSYCDRISVIEFYARTSTVE
jgi:hypothetical protein